MSRRVLILIFAIFILVFGLVFFYLLKNPKPETVSKEESAPAQEQLRIISTNPDPLDNATLLPSQNIEISFNKVIPKSEFKYEFDPKIDSLEIEALNGADNTKGSIMKIKFTKPLQLGGGYTLRILPGTRTETESEKLDREYIYHFKTIQYKGV